MTVEQISLYVGAAVAIVLEYGLEPWVAGWATMSANKKRSIVLALTAAAAAVASWGVCAGWFGPPDGACTGNGYWVALAANIVRAVAANQTTHRILPKPAKSFDTYAR